MKEPIGTTGLILNEPLLWEKGNEGRCGFSLPHRDVEPSPLDTNLTGDGPDNHCGAATRAPMAGSKIHTGLTEIGTQFEQDNPAG